MRFSDEDRHFNGAVTLSAFGYFLDPSLGHLVIWDLALVFSADCLCNQDQGDNTPTSRGMVIFASVGLSIVMIDMG